MITSPMNRAWTAVRRGAVTAVLAVLVTACAGTPIAGQAFPAGAPGAAAPDSAAGSPVAEPAAAQPDACSLLTQDEAKTLAKAELDAGQRVGVENGAATLCQFVGGPTGPVAQVEVFVGDGAKKILDIDRQLDHEFDPIPAMGDEAYEEGSQVFMRKGAVWASVRLVRLIDSAEKIEPLRVAAALVVSRM